MSGVQRAGCWGAGLGLAVLWLACAGADAPPDRDAPHIIHRFLDELDLHDPRRAAGVRVARIAQPAPERARGRRPLAAHTRRAAGVRVANEYRNALEGDFRSQPIRVPAGALLDFGIALVEGSHGRVRFTIVAETAGEERLVFSKALAPRASGEVGWIDSRVDLAELEDEEARFRFETRALDARGKTLAQADVTPVWSDPILIPAAGEQTAPSLILISLDTLGARHMGSYGYERDTTPNLDRFAREALLFERCIAPSSWTTPSHATVFTGLPLSVHGAGGLLGFRLREGFTTLAEIARDNGYLTAAYTDGAAVGAQLGFDQGFARYSNGPEQQPPPPGSAETTFRAARGWLERYGHLPFVLFLHTYEIHWPYGAPEPYHDMFLADGKPAVLPEEETAEHLRSGTLDDAQKRYYAARYDAGIAYTDHVVGGFLDAVRAMGLLENTIVIVFADHGESFWEHGATEHGLHLYNEVLHVPLIVRLAGADPPRGRIETPVALGDVFATSVDLLGVDREPPSDSKSLRPLWDDTGGTYDRSLITSELYQGEMHSLMLAAQTPGYKYITTTDLAHNESPLHGYVASSTDPPGRMELTLLDFLLAGGRDVSDSMTDEERHAMFMSSREELYHLAADPSEAEDLVLRDTRTRKEFRESLKAALFDSARDAEGIEVTEEEIAPLSEKEREELKALGYLQ